MWTTFVLCFLVAFAAAEKQHGAWRQETEYRYQVHTQTLAAIPNLKNQWIGLYTKADLTILPVSKDTLIGKLSNGKYSEFHKALPEGPANYHPKDELSYEPMDLNEQPFEIRLNEGAIHSIAVDRDMTNLELNQLKSIVSQFQVDIQGRNYQNSPHSHLPLSAEEEPTNSQAVYRVMEPTVTGKTETYYDITRVPLYVAQSYPESNNNLPLKKDEAFYEIYKTKNYTESEQRVGYHFGVHGLNDWKPNNNLMGSLSKSGISRVVISGSFDKFTIRSSTTTNRVVKTNEDKESQHDMMVVSQVNVTLVKMEENSGRPQIESERLVDVGNLVYSYDVSSDEKNSLRPKKDSSEENDDDDDERTYQNNALFGHAQNQEDNEKSNPALGIYWGRHRRSTNGAGIRKHQSRQYSRNNDYNEGDDDDYYSGAKMPYVTYLPKPTLNNAPESPFSALFVGNKGRSIQNSKKFNAPEEIEKLVEEIARDLKNVNDIPKKNTLRKFNIVAKVIRTMNSKQIKETTKAFDRKYEKTNEKSQQIYRDALLSAGTGPAVNELMNWIEEGKLEGETAAEMITGFPRNIREPTEEVQKRFFEFVKNDAVRKQSNVNVTAGIAFTRFLFQSKVNKKSASKYYPVQSYGPLSDEDSKFISEEVVPYFAEQLKEAVHKKDAAKTLYAIRALGNMGHKSLPKIFEPYLMDKEHVTDFQRMAIILAFDKSAESNERTAQTILFKMFQNRGETQEIRSVAAMQLIRSLPVAAVLQRIAEETNTDDNEHVRAVVRSAFESAAKLQNPENREFAEIAKAALNLLKPETQGYQYSRTHLRDYAEKEMDASYNQQSSYTVNQDSFLPNGFFLTNIANLGGFKQMNQFQAVVSSIEELANSFANEFKSSKSSQRRYNNNNNNNNNDYDDNEQNQDNEQNGQDNESNWSAEKIMKLLKMKPNKSKHMEGQVFLNYLNTERFFAFDKNSMEQLPKVARKLAEQLRDGADVKYTKLYNKQDVTISFPLETGLPFTYIYRTPALIQIKGKVRAYSTPNVASESNEYHVRVPESVNISAEFDAVYSIENEVSVSFMNPSTRQIYSAGYDKKIQVNVPFHVKSDIDIRNREIKTEFKPLNAEKTTKFLQMGSYPYTGRDDIYKLRPLTESEHTKEIRSRPVRESKFSFGEKETGYEFVVEGTQEKDSNQLANIYNQLRKHDFASFMLFGQQTTSPQHYSLTVALDGARSSSKSTKFTVKYDRNAHFNNEQGQQYRDQRSHPRARGQTADGQENLAIPEDSKPNSNERRQQFLRNAADDMTTPNGADVLDFSLEFDGPRKIAYVATIAGANDKSEGKARVLAFVQKSETETNNKEAYLQVDAKYQSADELRQSNNRASKPFADVRFKLSYAYDNNVELGKLSGKVQMKQSAEFQKYYNAQEEAKSADESPEVHPNTIDHVDVELDYSQLPVEQFGVKPYNVYNYVRYSTFYYLNENTEYNGEKDKLSFEVRFAPDMESADATLKTPKMKTEWKGIDVPKAAKNVFVVPRNGDWIDEAKREAAQDRDSCTISGSKVNTFENSTVKYGSLGRTWHLAVHKMHEPSTWQNDNEIKQQKHYASVLVRDESPRREYENENQSNDDKKNKEVLIVLHQKTKNDVTIRMTPAKDGSKTPRVYVNEHEKDLSSTSETEVRSTESPKEVLARVYTEEQHGSNQEKRRVRVEITLGNLEVTYDGKNVQVRSKSFYRNNRGICGAFTGQRSNELKSPQNKIVNNGKDFVASWAVIEGNSNDDNKLQTLQRKIQQTSYPSEEIYYSNPVPNEKKTRKYNEESNNNEQNSNIWGEYKSNSDSNSKPNTRFGTKHQTQYVEDYENQRICFSKRALPACPPGTKANGKSPKEVEVYCRNINDDAAQQYKTKIQRGHSLDMSSYPTTMKVKFNVPKRCEQSE